MIETDILGKKMQSNAPGLLFPNGLGGFYYYTLNTLSKYCGLFFYNGKELYKTLENVGIGKMEGSIIYKGYEFEVKSKEGSEIYFYPKKYNALVYNNNSGKAAKFIFDCREAYDFSVWGRNYELYVEGGVIILRYKKFHDEQEQNSKEYEIYCAIVVDKLDYSLNDQWTERFYEFDDRRNDNGKAWVYDAFSFKGKKAVIASAKKILESYKKDFDNLAKR